MDEWIFIVYLNILIQPCTVPRILTSKRHTLYFLGGFAAVAVGFVVLLAGFFAGSGPVLYTGAGFMGCAAAVQSLLLFSQSRATRDKRTRT